MLEYYFLWLFLCAYLTKLEEKLLFIIEDKTLPRYLKNGKIQFI